MTARWNLRIMLREREPMEPQRVMLRDSRCVAALSRVLQHASQVANDLVGNLGLISRSVCNVTCNMAKSSVPTSMTTINSSHTWKRELQHRSHIVRNTLVISNKPQNPTIASTLQGTKTPNVAPAQIMALRGAMQTQRTLTLFALHNLGWRHIGGDSIIWAGATFGGTLFAQGPAANALTRRAILHQSWPLEQVHVPALLHAVSQMQ